MAGDTRIVSGGQNEAPIVAADVRALPRADALIVAQVNASGDIVNPGGGGAGGDGAINDGADSGIKATVRDYSASNPLAVAQTNTSGDVYGEPTAPLLQTVAGRISAAGSASVVSAVSGRRVKVTGYSLQGDGDNARGFFASGASGAQLTAEWELASREGVVRQVEGGRSRGFLFATSPGSALSFESSSARAMKYDVTYHVEDAS